MRQKQKYYGIAYDNDEQRTHFIHILAVNQDSALERLANIYPEFHAVAVYTAEELLTQALDLIGRDPKEIEKYAKHAARVNNA